MIRLTEDVVAEIRQRKCAPLEVFVFGFVMQMWPMFQTAMTQHSESLKKLVDGSSGYFTRGVTITDASLATICSRYAVIFLSCVSITRQPEETIIFSNLSRMRQELVNVVTKHIGRMGKDWVKKAELQSTVCKGLLQGLRDSSVQPHPKLQLEIAFWAAKEEEARRLMSAAQSLPRSN
jgi:hypothetical protein